MAANVHIIEDRAKWEVFREILGELEDGGIVIGPDEAARLRTAYGDEFVDEIDGQLIEYDFGGDPDCWVDWSNTDAVPDEQNIHMGVEAMLRHTGRKAPGDT